VLRHLLGAFAAASHLVSLESVCAAIAEEVPQHREKNIAAAREAATHAHLLAFDHAEAHHV